MSNVLSSHLLMTSHITIAAPLIGRVLLFVKFVPIHSSCVCRFSNSQTFYTVIDYQLGIRRACKYQKVGFLSTVSLSLNRK